VQVRARDVQVGDLPRSRNAVGPGNDRGPRLTSVGLKDFLFLNRHSLVCRDMHVSWSGSQTT